MAPKKQTKAYKRQQKTAGTRSIELEVFSDLQARNQLATALTLTPKRTSRLPLKATVKKEQRRARLYGTKKQPREYSDKELDLPQLNRAIQPGATVKKGKKGKVFVEDGDLVVLNRLIRQINDDRDAVNESKLEKARRLEEIRELRRQEMERKEQEKQAKVDEKKSELKNKANVARAARRKREKEERAEEQAQQTAGKKRKVAFA